MKRKLLLLGAFFLAAALTACQPKAVEISGADREAVLAFSEPKTDNLLAGLNSGEYAVFSADFDPDMLGAIQESDFEALKADRDAKLGAYLSRSVATVFEQDGFYVVVYTAAFEKADAVTIRVVFRPSEPHQVSGLWFSK